MLKTSCVAADVARQDSKGNAGTVGDYLGEENVLLYLMRSTSCSVCNANVQDLARRDEMADRHVRVLVAMLTKKLLGAMQQSGSVLIDRHGMVRHARAATMPVANDDKKGFAAAIRGLERGPAGSNR